MDDFDECLGYRIGSVVDNDIGVERLFFVNVGFDKHPFLHAGTQSAGQAPLQLIAGIGHQPLMDISPVLFQVGVHSGKRAALGHGKPPDNCMDYTAQAPSLGTSAGLDLGKESAVA
jgi:hypothetical protein